MASEVDDRIHALEAETRHLRAMLESAPSFITRITLDGKFIYLNQLAPGFSMQDVVGTSVNDYVPAAFRERAHEAMHAAIATRSTQEYSTIGHVTPSRVGHYLTRVSPVLENGEVTSLVMVATDVTALAEQRMLLQLALDATGLGMWTYEPASGIGSWDEAARRIFGLNDVDPPRGLEWILHERIHPEDRHLIAERLEQVASTGRYGPLEHRILLPDGGMRWLAASGTAVRDHQGEVVKVVGTVQDITERRALEARLLAAQKLESIGRLAGGVAHDFNNMLTAIIGNAAFAATTESMAEVRPLLAEIRTAAERSAALTAQLLAFARRQAVEPTVLDPNAVIQRLEALLRRLLGDRIRFSLSLAAKGAVRIGESQLEQVVLNLITNARDALVQGGSVRLETFDTVLEQADADNHADMRPGRYVAVVVSDTGPGIEPEHLPHLFEPFFTTREAGTGLGLSTCYGIVKQCGGHITAESTLGVGSTFRVCLPEVEAEGPQEVAPPASARDNAGPGRVLLVEDEPSVRDVIARILAANHYRVVVAATALEALMLAEREGPFDLLLADVVMPDIEGPELARRLRARHPDLRVLFISGYAPQFWATGVTKEPKQGFLQKPFEPADLVRVVRQLMNA